MSMRGVVIAAPFEMHGDRCTIKNSALDSQNLREYLLYWDRLDWPDNNIIGLGSTPDVDFLIRESILSRTRINFGSVTGNMGLVFLTSQVLAFQKLTKSEPGAWSIAQCSNALFLPVEGVKQEQSVEVDLYRALPVPAAEVPLQEILEFKNRRAPELAALRAALDELYLQVVSSADIPRARIAALASLEAKLHDLHLVFEERWTRRIMSSIKIELNIPELVAKAAGTAALASSFNLPIATCAAGVAAASAIKFEAKPCSRLNGLPKELRALAYVKYAHEEL